MYIYTHDSQEANRTPGRRNGEVSKTIGVSFSRRSAFVFFVFINFSPYQFSSRREIGNIG